MRLWRRGRPRPIVWYRTPTPPQPLEFAQWEGPLGRHIAWERQLDELLLEGHIDLETRNAIRRLLPWRIAQ